MKNSKRVAKLQRTTTASLDDRVLTKAQVRAQRREDRRKKSFKDRVNKDTIARFFLGTGEKKGLIRNIVVYGLLICIGFVYLYPMLYMLSTSFMDQNDLLDTSVKWIPSHLYLQNYKDAAASLDFWHSFLKGIAIAGIPTLLNVVICMMVGYGFASYNFKGKKPLMVLLILTYILPHQVTMIPTYVLYNNMGILGTLWTFILPALFGNGLNSPIFILIFYQFFKQVPKVLMEAASIDGAGHFERFFKIAVPSAVPAIVTVLLFSFVWYWNESYLTELYVQGLSSKSMWTNLVVQLKNFDTAFTSRASTMGTGSTATSLNEALRMAATNLSILPLLIMYLILQRQFVESIDRAGITGE